MQKAIANKNSFVSMKNNTSYTAHQGYEDKENQYILYLRKIFGKGMVLKADIETQQEH